MTEPDVTLTDYGLAVENALFAYLMFRQGRARDLAAWGALFFAAGSLGALAGGTVHGFFLDERTLGARILWPVALLAIGVSATAAWAFGARLVLPTGVARVITIAAGLEFLAYAVVILTVTRIFAAAIVNYVPAAVFLLLALSACYLRTGQRPALVAAIGVALVFVASGVQFYGVALHPVWFNHNSVYHLFQAVALLLLFVGARAVVPCAGGVSPC